MRRIQLSLAAAVAAVALTAAPAGAAVQGPPTLEEVIWVVKCVGDSLGGNACHG